MNDLVRTRILAEIYKLPNSVISLLVSLSPQERDYLIGSCAPTATSTGQILWQPLCELKMYAAMTARTYRIQVQANGRVDTMSWGLAKDVEDTYDSVDALPEWMQRKIATLMIFDPAKVNEEIKGLGRRISKGTFWLFPDEGEDDGNDTGTPSKGEGA